MKIKKLIILSLAILASISLTSAKVKVGESAPDFTLTSASGNSHKLSDFKGKYVVLEWLNHGCPFVKKHYSSGNMQSLQKKLTGEGYVWLSINSSAPGKQGFMEADAAKAATKSKDAAPTAVLLDTTGTVGKLYGAKTTPEIFMISPEGEIIYHGAIDSIKSANPGDIAKAENYVLAAFKNLQSGEAIATPKTKPYGCGVKY